MKNATNIAVKIVAVVAALAIVGGSTLAIIAPFLVG